jgi:hypothetical protein
LLYHAEAGEGHLRFFDHVEGKSDRTYEGGWVCGRRMYGEHQRWAQIPCPCQPFAPLWSVEANGCASFRADVIPVSVSNEGLHDVEAMLIVSEDGPLSIAAIAVGVVSNQVSLCCQEASPNDGSRRDYKLIPDLEPAGAEMRLSLWVCTMSSPSSANGQAVLNLAG